MMRQMYKIMMDDARILLQEGADGIAFGFLDEHGRVAAEDTAAMCGLSRLLWQRGGIPPRL